jgi:hypothetical protein
MRHSNKGEKLLRRKFLSAAGAIAGGVVLGASVVPRTALGSAQRPAPSQRVNLAMIGVGSQGLRVMFNFLREPDVQIVAVCDANRQSSDYHQWAHNEFCNSVRRLLGANSGWEWLSPNKPLRLTQLLTVTSGTAGYEPARQIVEAYYGKDRPAGQYKGCKTYADFRELLEKQSDVDAIVVCTHDTLHAPVAIAAMRKGKHVWCQKPMTYSVAEARKMAQVARETAVATQVAVANAASEDTRRLCEWVASGAPCARSDQLVKPAVLAAGDRTPCRNSPGARGTELGTVAGAFASPPVSSGLSAVCMARLVRLRLRCAGRHGLLQLRHYLPGVEAGGARLG